MSFTEPKPKYLVLLLLLVWLSMCVGDWFMRFYWFGWQRNWLRPKKSETISTAIVSTGNYSFVSPFETQEVPSVRGGDLTRLIDIPSYISSFEQTREAYQRIVDRDGFYSPYEATQTCPIVVVGDSFMVEGQGWSNTFSGQLAAHLGVPVRNRGVAAKGAVMPLVEYLDSWQFENNRPGWLVFGLLEREMTQRMLAGGMVFQLWQDEHPDTGTVTVADPGRVRWGMLTPGVLKWQLPNTSVISKVGKDVWNTLRFHIFGRINPDVVASERSSASDGELLFYRETIDLMALGDEERGVEQIVWALEYLSDYLQRHDVQLVLLLIPDKAQVYRSWLPERYNESGTLPPSCLWEVEAELQAKGIPVVNLLRPYRADAKSGSLLYWRDDTHWNAEGIRLAAEYTAAQIREYQKRSKDKGNK